MNKKNVFLIGGILAALVFTGFLAESEPQTFFGFSVNIWVYRIAWLIVTTSMFANYFKMKKSEKESN